MFDSLGVRVRESKGSEDRRVFSPGGAHAASPHRFAWSSTDRPTGASHTDCGRCIGGQKNLLPRPPQLRDAPFIRAARSRLQGEPEIFGLPRGKAAAQVSCARGSTTRRLSFRAIGRYQHADMYDPQTICKISLISRVLSRANNKVCFITFFYINLKYFLCRQVVSRSDIYERQIFISRAVYLRI